LRRLGGGFRARRPFHQDRAYRLSPVRRRETSLSRPQRVQKGKSLGQQTLRPDAHEHCEPQAVNHELYQKSLAGIDSHDLFEHRLQRLQYRGTKN
jgi:ribosomal protein L15E